MGILDKILERFEPTEPEPEPEPNAGKQSSERYIGKIVKLDKGWGFIVSRQLPYTRVFFHWSGLNQGTKRFVDLEKGDEVEFNTLELPNRGIRAIYIEVLKND